MGRIGGHLWWWKEFLRITPTNGGLRSGAPVNSQLLLQREILQNQSAVLSQVSRPGYAEPMIARFIRVVRLLVVLASRLPAS